MNLGIFDAGGPVVSIVRTGSAGGEWGQCTVCTGSAGSERGLCKIVGSQGGGMLTLLTDCVRVRFIGVRAGGDWDRDLDLDLRSVGGDAEVDGADESLVQITDGRSDLVAEG